VLALRYRTLRFDLGRARQIMQRHNAHFLDAFLVAYAAGHLQTLDGSRAVIRCVVHEFALQNFLFFVSTWMSGLLLNCPYAGCASCEAL
jgi:hypothetical protein